MLAKMNGHHDIVERLEETPDLVEACPLDHLWRRWNAINVGH